MSYSSSSPTRSRLPPTRTRRELRSSADCIPRSSSPRRSVLDGGLDDDASDEFISVLQSQPHRSSLSSVLPPPPSLSHSSPSTTSSPSLIASSSANNSPRFSSTSSPTHIGDGVVHPSELYIRIEEQLELLDQKRLGLQQMLRSYRDAPYSSRLARSIDFSRVDCGKLARKIASLFRYRALHMQDASPPPLSLSPSSTPANDGPTIAQFQLLFANFAAVSEILNQTCLDSIRFEDELASSKRDGGGSRKPSLNDSRRSSLNDSSAIKHRVVRSTSLASSPSSSFSPGSFNSSLEPQQQMTHGITTFDSPLSSATSDVDSLPLLEVHGLDGHVTKREEYMQLSTMVVELSESFTSLAAITAAQQADLDRTSRAIESTLDKTRAGEADLRQASRYKAFGLVFAGGLTGAAIGGPIGAIVGLKIGVGVGVGVGLLGVGGAVVGAVAGKQIQKARFVSLDVPPTGSPDGATEEMQPMTDGEKRRRMQHSFDHGTDEPSSSSSTSTSASSSQRSTPSHSPMPPSHHARMINQDDRRISNRVF